MTKTVVNHHRIKPKEVIGGKYFRKNLDGHCGPGRKSRDGAAEPQGIRRGQPGMLKQIGSIDGGSLRNAIPRESVAEFVIPEKEEKALDWFIKTVIIMHAKFLSKSTLFIKN